MISSHHTRKSKVHLRNYAQIILSLFVLCSLVPALALGESPIYGVYSGSFDPPTLAHRAIIQSSIEEQKLDKLFVLVNTSGSKDFRTSVGDRIEMLKSATGGLSVEFIPVWQHEKDELTDRLRETHQGSFYQFIGEDSFNNLPIKWSDSPMDKWIVFARPGQSKGSLPQSERVVVMDLNRHLEGVSSTLVRKKLNEGDYDISELHPKTIALIRKNGWYLEPDATEIEVQKRLFEKAFSEFRHQLQAELPQLKNFALLPPEFNPTQAGSAWVDKFSRWAFDQAEVVGLPAETLREAASRAIANGHDIDSQVPHHLRVAIDQDGLRRRTGITADGKEVPLMESINHSNLPPAIWSCAPKFRNIRP